MTNAIASLAHTFRNLAQTETNSQAPPTIWMHRVLTQRQKHPRISA